MLKRFAYFLRKFLLPHWLLFSCVILTGLLAASTSGLGLPLMIKFIFPLVFHSGGDEVPELLRICPSLGELPHSVLLLMACASLPLLFLVRGVAQWLNAFMVNWLGLNVLEMLRTEVFDRVMALPMAFLDEHHKGDMVSRILTDTQNVQNILGAVANDLIKQPITALSALSAFLYLLFSTGQGMLLLVNIFFISLAIWPIFIFGRRISVKALRAQQGMGELNTTLQQNLETQREVRAYALEEREIEEFTAVSARYCANYVKLVKYQKGIVPVIETATAMAMAFLLVRGRLVGMVMSDFLALASALFFFFDALKRAGNAFNRFNEAQGSLTRLAEVLGEPITIPDPENPEHFQLPVRGDIDMCHVDFAYVEGKKVLRDINLHIPAGQVVGLVGPSGAGKTTFANLLPRFYEVSSGAVKVDGMDVRNVTQHELREQISYVGQQALLFGGTIAENIKLGKETATDAEVEQAAQAAAVTTFLPQLAAGLETEVGEGGKALSGGQRQRVAIARAFVKDAPILILDEATASLDAKSEREIQEALDSLSKGRTTLIVAHRFSTIRHADRILVFDAGRIVGDGTHDELYSTCPLYKELYDRQGITAE